MKFLPKPPKLEVRLRPSNPLPPSMGKILANELLVLGIVLIMILLWLLWNFPQWFDWLYFSN